MEVMTESKVLTFVSGLKEPNQLSNTRKEALQALQGMDFPTTRVEDWKYTRVGRLVKKQFHEKNVELSSIADYEIEGLGENKIVFVNGFYNEKLSSIVDHEVINVQSIDQIDEEYYQGLVEDTEENVFSLINKAYNVGGVYIKVEKNSKVNTPIQLIHILTGNDVIANVRHFIQMEQGAKAEVVSSFHSLAADSSFSNVVLEGHVAANSSLTIQKIQAEEKTNFHMDNELFIQEEGSHFKINTITTGGLLTRNGLNVLVEGQNCHTEMNGAYLGRDNQHMDNHTLIDQMYSNCTSSETYKGVMDDKSVGVFNGKVIVREDAQNIEAYQSNGNILLSDHSSVNSKPELEIYADDVRCSHGSTIGQLDEEALFYLRSRGISAMNAKKLLVAAFIGDVLDKIENDHVRKWLDDLFFEEYGWMF